MLTSGSLAHPGKPARPMSIEDVVQKLWAEVLPTSYVRLPRWSTRGKDAWGDGD